MMVVVLYGYAFEPLITLVGLSPEKQWLDLSIWDYPVIIYSTVLCHKEWNNHNGIEEVWILTATVYEIWDEDRIDAGSQMRSKA